MIPAREPQTMFYCTWRDVPRGNEYYVCSVVASYACSSHVVHSWWVETVYASLMLVSYCLLVVVRSVLLDYSYEADGLPHTKLFAHFRMKKKTNIRITNGYRWRPATGNPDPRGYLRLPLRLPEAAAGDRQPEILILEATWSYRWGCLKLPEATAGDRQPKILIHEATWG